MAQYLRTEVAQLDMETGSDYDVSSGEEPQRRFWKPRYTVAAVLGAAALAGCGAALSLNSASVAQQQPKKLTARMLFESDAIHHAAAENVLNAHSKLHGAQKSKEEVKEIVAKTFKNIVDTMKTVDPDTWNALERAELTQEQHDGVAHVLKSKKDPRMMQLGLDAAAALRTSKSDSKNAQAKAVYDKLMPRRAEIRALYDEVIPKHLQEDFKYKPGAGFKTMLKKENVKRLKTVGGTYYDQFTAPEKTIATTERRLFFKSPGVQQMPYNPYAAPGGVVSNPAVAHAAAMIPQPPHVPSYQYQGEGTPMKKALEALGIVGTVTAEADTIIRVINPICKEFNHDLLINPKITTGIGAADFIFQMADCEADAFADHMNPVEALGCPAMASSAGFDAMREVFAATGVLGDNDLSNGEQGNHEGESKVHEGVLDDSSAGKMAEDSFPLCMLFQKCNQATSGDDEDADDDHDHHDHSSDSSD